ncbi:hypothetical protein [Methylobacter sp.]|nr:hypothetical protein [Methylobacter sp.]
MPTLILLIGISLFEHQKESMFSARYYPNKLETTPSFTLERHYYNYI